MLFCLVNFNILCPIWGPNADSLHCYVTSQIDHRFNSKKANCNDMWLFYILQNEERKIADLAVPEFVKKKEQLRKSWTPQDEED